MRGKPAAIFLLLLGRMLSLSLVIPALNEADELPATTRCARAVPQATEIIVVDGGSSDGTCAIAEKLGCKVLTSSPSRGGQMRLGASQATGDIIVLVHADTWLPQNAGHAIEDCLHDPDVVGGGFWKTFREAHPLRIGARWRSGLLFALGGPILGDQAPFVRREILERIGGVPDMPLMEEFELCRGLREVGRLKLANATVRTSMRRFHKLGILRTYFLMGRVILRYRQGVTSDALARLYDSCKE